MVFVVHLVFCPVVKQELSYRKQIARQLHTQYVKGIYIGLITDDLEI